MNIILLLLAFVFVCDTLAYMSMLGCSKGVPHFPNTPGKKLAALVVIGTDVIIVLILFLIYGFYGDISFQDPIQCVILSMTGVLFFAPMLVVGVMSFCSMEGGQKEDLEIGYAPLEMCEEPV